MSVDEAVEGEGRERPPQEAERQADGAGEKRKDGQGHGLEEKGRRGADEQTRRQNAHHVEESVK